MTMMSKRNLLPALAVVVMAPWVACDQPQAPGTKAIVIPATAAEDGAKNVARPTLLFQDTMHAFGTISEGHVVTHQFAFRNEGPGEVLIADVSTTCGCTVPKTWPRHALAPGEEGVLEVSFDSHDKSGPQDKVISVVANTDPSVVRLHLVGEVLTSL